MENVPNVVGSKNIESFKQWIDSLSRMGYSNYYKIMNAKDYGIPQNRRRCFMVSLLGGRWFDFPKEIPLRYDIKGFLDGKTSEDYYYPDEIVEEFSKGL